MERRWGCPNCNAWAQTVDDSKPHHPCKGGNGMLIPLLQNGVKSKLVFNEREDYVGKEIVQLDISGRPVMNATVETEQGIGLTIYAPCATGKAEANGLD